VDKRTIVLLKKIWYIRLTKYFQHFYHAEVKPSWAILCTN